MLGYYKEPGADPRSAHGRRLLRTGDRACSTPKADYASAAGFKDLFKTSKGNTSPGADRRQAGDAHGSRGVLRDGRQPRTAARHRHAEHGSAQRAVDAAGRSALERHWPRTSSPSMRCSTRTSASTAWVVVTQPWTVESGSSRRPSRCGATASRTSTRRTTSGGRWSGERSSGTRHERRPGPVLGPASHPAVS